MPIISITRQDDIAILTWDEVGARVNTCKKPAMAELTEAMDRLIADPEIKGIVLASGKASFVVGADLEEMRAMNSEGEIRELLKTLDMFRRMETGGKTIVAALGGDAYGGGFEIALACHVRIAAPNARFGLPEVQHGLLPGGGGTQRLSRLVGLGKVLPYLTEGKPMTSDDALALGAVSAIVPKDELLDAAIAAARTAPAVQPWDTGASILTATDEERAALEQARKTCAKRSSNADIAEGLILDVLERGIGKSLEDGLSIESENFITLVLSPTAKNRVRNFFATRDARAMKGLGDLDQVEDITSVVVVGGGTMGSGIAYVAASAGLRVRMIEMDAAGADRAKAAIGKIAARQVKAGRLSEDAQAELLGRLSYATGYDGIADFDAAIEAVVEIENVKAEVMRNLGAAMKPDAFIASNTSTMSITRLAGYSGRPSQFIGAHFFSPVERMPLVEVILSPDTSELVRMRTLKLLKQLRKTPLVVNDGPGFFTSRCVASYTGEALTMVAEGIAPARIDAAAKRYGMVIGPCAMADLTGLKLLQDILGSITREGSLVTQRGSRAIEALDTLVAAGRLGRNAGAGIYDYPDGKMRDWPGLAALFPAEWDVSDADIGLRLMHAQGLEAARALEEGVVASATDADIGSLLGWMFPQSYGGVLSYIDTVGPQRFVEECEELAKRYGSRFSPPEGLVAQAQQNRRFHSA